MIPGGNLLNQAFALIGQNAFDYYKYTGRTVNTIGLYESAFDLPVTLSGSIQAVSRSVYQNLGLDFQKQYITIFVSSNVIDMARGRSGDEIAWNGRRYQLANEMNWYEVDGWTSFMAVEIGDQS